MTQRFDAGRRRTLAAAGATAAWLLAPRGMAALDPTPGQTRGPFYPGGDELPLETDNDLVRVDGSDVAEGVVTDLRGRVVDPAGRPVDDAVVEIWQCDASGRYIQQLGRRPGSGDPAFQGFGTFTTGTDGRYRFRTIRPVPYPGRAPHIHFRVVSPGGRELVTQLYVAGHPGNRDDWILRSAPDPQRLIVPFEPVDGPDAERRATFDIVVAAD